MALAQRGNRSYSGNAGDKPASLPEGSTFIDIDTPALWISDSGGALTLISGGTGTSGTSTSDAALVFSPTGQTTAIIKSGRTETNYGNAGQYAVDLSHSNSASSTRGATSSYSFAVGLNNTSSGGNSTVSGGYNNTNSSYAGFIGAGASNTVSGFYGVIVGGDNNTASGGYNSVVVGGNNNTASTNNSGIVAGEFNTISGSSHGFIGGGQNNIVSGTISGLIGGSGNTVSGSYSIIGGGMNNEITTGIERYSFIAGGRNNIANHDNVFILGSDITSTQTGTTYVEQFNIQTPLIVDTGTTYVLTRADDGNVVGYPLSGLTGGTGTTPNLQQVTDVGNVTTLNISALSFNDLYLFSQTSVDIHNIAIGIEAMANGNTGDNSIGIGYRALYGNSGVDATAVGHLAMSNNQSGGGCTGIGYGAMQSNSGGSGVAVGKFAARNNTQDSVTAIGYQALNDNTGIYATGVGHSALDNNSGGQVSGLGYTAGFNNTGVYATLVGYAAGYANSGTNSTGIGGFSLRSNIGNNSTALGYSSGYNNTGDNIVAIGALALEYNTSGNTVGVGYSTLQYNNNIQTTAIGDYAAQYNQGINVVSVGYNSITFQEDTGSTKNVVSASTDINTSLETISITGHSFGSAGEYVNLKYTTTGTPIGGLTSGLIYQFLVVDSNTLQSVTNLSSVGTDVHSFTPQFVYDNVTVLGANAEPTQSNQVMLGDSGVTSVRTANINYVATDLQDFLTLNDLNRQKNINGSYTLLSSDNNSLLVLSSATAFNITVNSGLTDNFEVEFINIGTSTVTFLTSGTANLNYPDGTIFKANKVAMLVKIGSTNNYWLKGELE